MRRGQRVLWKLIDFTDEGLNVTKHDLIIQSSFSSGHHEGIKLHPGGKTNTTIVPLGNVLFDSILLRLRIRDDEMYPDTYIEYP